VKIGTDTELIPKWEEPSTRQRRKVLAGKIVIAVRPHEVFTRPRHPPGSKRFAADEWAKHLALDPAAAVASGNRRDVILDSVDVDDVRSVASRLDPEHWASERAACEGSTTASNYLECFPHGWREQNPWASGRVVKTEGVGSDRPSHGAIGQSNPYVAVSLLSCR